MMNSGASSLSLYSGGLADGAPVPRQAYPEEPYQPPSHREEHYQPPRDLDLATYEPTFHIHQRRAASPPLSSEMVTRDVNMLPNINYGTRTASSESLLEGDQQQLVKKRSPVAVMDMTSSDSNGSAPSEEDQGWECGGVRINGGVVVAPSSQSYDRDCPAQHGGAPPAPLLDHHQEEDDAQEYTDSLLYPPREMTNIKTRLQREYQYSKLDDLFPSPSDDGDNSSNSSAAPSFGFGGGRGAGTRGLATKFGSAPADLYSYDASCSTSVGVSSSAEQAGNAMEAGGCKNVAQKHPNKYGSLAPNLYAHGSSGSFQNFLDRSGTSCSKASIYSDGEQPLEREDTGAALSLASVDDFSSAAARKMEDFVVSGNRAPDGYDVLDHILNKGTLTGLGIGISLASEPSTLGGMAGMNVMMSGQTNKKPTIDESMFGLGPEGEVDAGARVSDKLEGPSPIDDALAAELGPPEPPMEGTARTETRTTAIKPERDGEDQQKLFLEMSCDLQASSEGALTCSPQIVGDVADAELIEKMSRELKEKDARIARLEEQFLALSKKEEEKKASSPTTAANPDPLFLGVNRLRELPTLPEPPTFKSYRTVLAEHDALLSSNSPTVCRASVGSHSPDAVSGSGGSARKILSASPIGAVRFSPVVARPPLFQSSKQPQSLNTHGGITQCFNISTPAYKSPSVSRVFPTPNSSVIKKTGSGAGGKPGGVAGPGANIFNKASTIMTASTSSAGSAPRAVKSILKTSGVITSSVSKYASRINSKIVMSANASGGRSSSSGAGATANTNSNTAEKLLAKEASVKEVRTLTIKDGDGGATSGSSDELVDEKGNTGVNLQSSPKTATEVCGPPLVLLSNTEQQQSEQNKPANHNRNAGDEDHEVQKKTGSGGRRLDCAEQRQDEYTHSDGEFVLRPLTQQKSSFYVLPDVILEERGAMVSSPEAEHEGDVDASSLVPEARSRKSSATSWTSTALQAPSETEMNALMNASARGRSRAGFAPAGAGKATLIPNKKRYGGNYPRVVHAGAAVPKRNPTANYTQQGRSKNSTTGAGADNRSTSKSRFYYPAAAENGVENKENLGGSRGRSSPIPGGKSSRNERCASPQLRLYSQMTASSWNKLKNKEASAAGGDHATATATASNSRSCHTSPNPGARHFSPMNNRLHGRQTESSRRRQRDDSTSVKTSTAQTPHTAFRFDSSLRGGQPTGNYVLHQGGGGVAGQTFAGARRSRQSTHDSSFVMLNTSSTLEKDTRNRSGRGSPFDRSPGTGKQPLRCVVAAKAIPPASVPTLNRPRLDQLGGSMNAGVVDLRGHFGTRSAAESVKMKSRSTSAQNSRGGSRARSRGSSQARGGGAGGLSFSGGSSGDQIFVPRSVGGLLPGGTHEERGGQGHEDTSGAQELVESLMSVHKAKKPPSPCPQKQQGGVDLTTPTNKRCGACVSNLRAGFNSVEQPLPNPPPVQHDFDANTNRENNFNLTINTSDQHNFSLLSCADEQLQNPQHTASSGGIIGGFAAATANSVAEGRGGTTSMNGMMNYETQRNCSRAASQSGITPSIRGHMTSASLTESQQSAQISYCQPRLVTAATFTPTNRTVVTPLQQTVVPNFTTTSPLQQSAVTTTSVKQAVPAQAGVPVTTQPRGAQLLKPVGTMFVNNLITTAAAGGGHHLAPSAPSLQPGFAMNQGSSSAGPQVFSFNYTQEQQQEQFNFHSQHNQQQFQQHKKQQLQQPRQSQGTSYLQAPRPALRFANGNPVGPNVLRYETPKTNLRELGTGVAPVAH